MGSIAYEGLELPRLQVREGEDEYTLEDYEREEARLGALGLRSVIAGVDVENESRDDFGG